MLFGDELFGDDKFLKNEKSKAYLTLFPEYSYKRTSKKFFKFDVIQMEKQMFHSSKRPIAIDDVDIDKILISNKFACAKKDFKYFIRYKNE